MLKNFDDLAREFKSEGNARRLQALADSPEGQRLAKQLDGKAVEQAARSGDTAALKHILAQVLSTPDGKALAQRLQEAMKEK